MGLTVMDGKRKVPGGPGLGITLCPGGMKENSENGSWASPGGNARPRSEQIG